MLKFLIDHQLSHILGMHNKSFLIKFSLAKLLCLLARTPSSVPHLSSPVKGGWTQNVDILHVWIIYILSSSVTFCPNTTRNEIAPSSFFSMLNVMDVLIVFR